jgi:hypothetical protein
VNFFKLNCLWLHVYNNNLSWSIAKFCWLLLVFDSLKLWALEDHPMDMAMMMIIITSCSFQFCCWNKIWEYDETISSIQVQLRSSKALLCLFLYLIGPLLLWLLLWQQLEWISSCGYVDREATGTQDFVRFFKCICQIIHSWTYILSGVMELLDVVSREPSNLLQRTQPFSGCWSSAVPFLLHPCHQYWMVWLWHDDNLIRASELSFTDGNKIRWLGNFFPDNWINIGCW